MNDLQIFDCEQGSQQWIDCRLGIPTASQFATVLAKGKGGGESLTRKTYLYKLAGEIITGKQMDSYSNGHMERGKEMEEEARNAYAFMHDVEPVKVGFMRRGDMGASPDSIVADSGLLELKTKLAHLQIEALLDGELPPEHRAQVQGQLLVSGREWVDFASYWPALPLFVMRVFRDEDYIKNLEQQLKVFNAELRLIVEQIRGKSA